MAGPAPPLVSVLTVGLQCWTLGIFLPILLVEAWTTRQPLQTVFTQPTPVLSLGLSPEARVSALCLCVYQPVHVLGWGVQGGGTAPLCWSVSVLPAANWLLHSSLSL